MKRARPANPVRPTAAREIIDLRSRSQDPRCDPGATAKISREELEEVLRRSSSGTRAAVRPDAGDGHRTRSGERVAVRPRPTDEASGDPPPSPSSAPQATGSHADASPPPARATVAGPRARQTRFAITIVLVTAALAVLAWFVGHYVGVLLATPEG